MAMDYNVMIINEKGTYSTYTINAEKAVAALFSALNMHVESEPGFKQNFSLTSDFWNTIKDTITTTNSVADFKTRVKIVNGFCSKPAYRIKKVFYGYSEANPDD